jgi:lactoylglutathione lyase
MIGRLGLVMLIVSDMPRSVAFYRDVLELGVEYESDAWTQFDAGGVSVGLHNASEGVPLTTGGAEIALYVDDAKAAVAKVRKRGAEIVQEAQQEEFGGVLAVIEDPDGYRIQLLEQDH